MKRMISEYYSNKNNSSSWIDKTKETGNMCGIVGFTGKHQAAPILLDGLSKLEYRGYDSAGIAVRDGENETEVIKAKGRLKVLIEKTNGGESVPGTCGIGHTRWATHGNRQKPMHILMSATMEMWLPYTTVSSKTIRN